MEEDTSIDQSRLSNFKRFPRGLTSMRLTRGATLIGEDVKNSRSNARH